MRKLKLSSTAQQQLELLVKQGKTDTLKRIKLLVKSTLETPFEGIGKPEALKYNYKGYWSRRINRTDRLIYLVTDENIYWFVLLQDITMHSRKRQVAVQTFICAQLFCCCSSCFAY
jgi:toxin YoeB